MVFSKSFENAPLAVAKEEGPGGVFRGPTRRACLRDLGVSGGFRLETLRCLDHASQKGFTEFKSRLASRKPMSCKHLSLTTSRSA